MGGSRGAYPSLPSVGILLESADLAPLVAEHGRSVVKDAIRAALDDARAAIARGASVEPAALRANIANLSAARSLLHLRRVINATGVILHTNLGRAPLAKAAVEAVVETARGYSTLELDLSTGERGSRHAHAEGLISALLGAEAGIAVNNCAGAVLLMLAAIARGREVIVSRGELVEIGGGFRVPDIMRESGAKLVEVGTTNKVYAEDYARAIGPETAAILVVHRSNFAMLGFTHTPSIEALATLARARGLPLLVDVGSGLVAEPALLEPLSGIPGFAEEPRPAQVIAAGADLIAMSGDKLLGGPQAGILAGRAALIDLVKKHPLARALRADKLSLSALEATLRLVNEGRSVEIPAVRAMTEPLAQTTARAEQLCQKLSDLGATLAEGEAVIGGGSLPLAKLPTAGVSLGPTGRGAERFAAALRQVEPPVIARIAKDRVFFDLKTVDDVELDELSTGIRSALGRMDASA
ncbi:MAG: L-seryl-tRNA(Sec) selenium transferase [Myxococcota bacterium]